MRNHATIANKYTYDVHAYTHAHVFLNAILGKVEKGLRKLGRDEKERVRERGLGRLMRREMMEFANHPALHFSLPCSRFPRLSKSSSPHFPSPLICKPYAPYFPGAWLKGAVHFTLARMFLLTLAGFNKKFKSRRPAAPTRQSSISALKPAT